MSHNVIINGGEPLKDCPKDWEAAAVIQNLLNNGKDCEPGEFATQPVWSFDCGFKLDFDGPMVQVSSRFYPPKIHYGLNWDGTVSINVFGEEIESKEFNCETISELKEQVEEYVNTIKEKIISLFKNNKHDGI